MPKSGKSIERMRLTIGNVSLHYLVAVDNRGMSHLDCKTGSGNDHCLGTEGRSRGKTALLRVQLPSPGEIRMCCVLLPKRRYGCCDQSQSEDERGQAACYFHAKFPPT